MAQSKTAAVTTVKNRVSTLTVVPAAANKTCLIPCSGSAGSSASSGGGRHALFEEDVESQLFSPASPSDFSIFSIPDKQKHKPQQQMNSQQLQLPNAVMFERRSAKKGHPPISPTQNMEALNGALNGMQPIRRQIFDSKHARPSTSIGGARHPILFHTPISELHHSRGSSSLSFQSSSTSSDEYSISLPSTSSRQYRSATSRGRHLSSSMSDESRANSRQSILTTSSTYSILDTRQIHLYLQKNGSQSSLTSIQTMSQMPVDGQEELGSGRLQRSASSSSLGTTSSLNNEKSQESKEDPPKKLSSDSSSSTSTQKLAAAALLRPGAEVMWRSATQSPDDEQVPRPRSQYIGELVWQVDPMVYCGGIQAAQNLNMLCRLNIEYIVDLCGEESETIARYYRPRPDCPCLCTRKTAHSRMTMTINIKDESESNSRVDLNETDNQPRQDIIAYFGDFVNLVHKARIAGKSVLIHSMKGRNRAPAFAAAYLMHSQRCTRVQALGQISVLMSKTRPGLAVSDNFLRALNQWQNLLGIKSSEGFLTTNSATVFQIKKAAWDV